MKKITVIASAFSLCVILIFSITTHSAGSEISADSQAIEITPVSMPVVTYIPIEDIYYIESNNRKIIIAMRDEKIECYGKIGGMERELQEGFFRTHRGYLVNMKYVERYSRTEVQMKNGSSLLISKYKYQDFVKAYLAYLAEDGR